MADQAGTTMLQPEKDPNSIEAPQPRHVPGHKHYSHIQNFILMITLAHKIKTNHLLNKIYGNI